METIGVIGFGVGLWLVLAPSTLARDTPRRPLPAWLGWLLAAECLLLLILAEPATPPSPDDSGSSSPDTTGEVGEPHTPKGWVRPIPTQLGEPAELPLVAPGMPGFSPSMH